MSSNYDDEEVKPPLAAEPAPLVEIVETTPVVETAPIFETTPVVETVPSALSFEPEVEPEAEPEITRTVVIIRRKRKMKKAKTKGKAKEKIVANGKVRVDRFGFRLDSKKSAAAKMYASKRGATIAEVEKEVGSTQFNLLTQLEGKGYKIKRELVRTKDGREVTRYHLVG